MKTKTLETVTQLIRQISAIISLVLFFWGAWNLRHPPFSDVLAKFQNLSDHEALSALLLILDMRVSAVGMMLLGIFLRILTLNVHVEIEHPKVPDDSASKSGAKKSADRDRHPLSDVAQARSAWTEDEKDE